MPLKNIKTKLEDLDLSRAAENILLIISLILIFDAVVAFLGASYLSSRIGAFWGKSGIVVLSDLLFLEGSMIFALGTFVAVVKALQKTKPPEHLAEQNLYSEKTQRKRLPPGITMILIGTALIGLSIVVGTLLLLNKSI